MDYQFSRIMNIGPRDVLSVIIEKLKEIPEDYEVDCCGHSTFYIHIDDENQTIRIDHDDFTRVSYTDEDIDGED